MIALGLSIVCLLAAPAETAPLRMCEVSEAMPLATDETVYCWLNGWNNAVGKLGVPVEPALVSVRTGRYGLVLDPFTMTIPHFGALDAASQRDSGAALRSLPATPLTLELVIGGKRYRCVQGADKHFDNVNFPVRLIEGGRVVQRFDVLNLVLEDDAKQRPPVDARFEVTAWPDRVCLLLEAVPQQDVPAAELHLALAVSGAPIEARTKTDAAWRAGASARVSVTWPPSPVVDADVADVSARTLRGDGGPLEVTADSDRGWCRIALPKEAWSVATDPDHLDRVKVELSNPADHERVFRLLFARDEPFEGVTGMCPMIRDEAGQPTGIPVQLSKNWHRQKDRRLLYEGPWFHGFSLLRLPAKSRFAFEFTMAYARWGGVPAASHAQLCLIGWGHNQIWDQAAIGSWGESICYEPDAIQRRCRITDVRPLMVRSMSATQPQWTWTNNVGGGDFLVYYDKDNRYQGLKRVETRYLSQGPCLTRVRYSGVTMDDAIRASVEVSLPRVDDYVRVFHTIRYDVVRAVPFERLAFYQLGADDYNWHADGRIARGNADGLVEEWAPKRGGRSYDRVGIPCDGAAPWFAMLDSDGGNDKNPGAWANRGMVVRSWKARLGGKDAAAFAAVYRSTSNKFDSALLELGPPPGVKELQAGDFVEAEVEMVIMPLVASDYYGPNEGLRNALASGANTWKMFHHEAAGNLLEVRCVKGELLRQYPVAARVGSDQEAELDVRGGVGYAPITFSGLTRHNGYRVVLRDGDKETPLDQAVHGADFWQTSYDAAARTWSQTYNVNLDGSAPGKPRTIRLEHVGG